MLPILQLAKSTALGTMNAAIIMQCSFNAPGGMHVGYDAIRESMWGEWQPWPKTGGGRNCGENLCRSFFSREQFCASSKIRLNKGPVVATICP